MDRYQQRDREAPSAGALASSGTLAAQLLSRFAIKRRHSCDGHVSGSRVTEGRPKRPCNLQPQRRSTPQTHKPRSHRSLHAADDHPTKPTAAPTSTHGASHGHHATTAALPLQPSQRTTERRASSEGRSLP